MAAVNKSSTTINFILKKGVFDLEENYTFDPQEKKFWLSYTLSWIPALGHEVKINDFSFALIIHKKRFLVVEIVTGAIVNRYPLYHAEMYGYLYALEDKGVLFDYYRNVIIPPLVKAVQARPDLPDLIKERLIRLERYGVGERPLIEVVE